MSTAREIITDSLKKIGVVAPGESLASSDENDALRALNNMLDSWSNRELRVLNTTIEEFTLVAGTNSYTMGSGATFNTTVPVHTKYAFIKDSDGNELPVELTFDSERWGRISVKSTQANYPVLCYIDRNYPNATVYLYPTPGAANTLILHNMRQLSNLSTLTTSLSLPVGYERAIIYNLAIELAPDYGKTVPAEVVQIADVSLTDIMRANKIAKKVRLDPALTGRGSYDYRTGGYVG